MSVDAQGRPVIVFAVCSGRIDGATIYRDRARADPEGEDPKSVEVADWDAAQAITPATALGQSLRTAMPSPYWRPTGLVEAMRLGVRYTAFGGTQENTYFTGHVEFTLERLAILQPGQVLSQTQDETADHDTDIVQSYDEFKHSVC